MELSEIVRLCENGVYYGTDRLINHFELQIQNEPSPQLAKITIERLVKLEFPEKNFKINYSTFYKRFVRFKKKNENVNKTEGEKNGESDLKSDKIEFSNISDLPRETRKFL